MKKSTFAQSAVAAAVITFLGLFAEVAQAQVVPTINVQETCRAAAGVMLILSVGGGVANDVQICVDSENKARDQIIKDWQSILHPTGQFASIPAAICRAMSSG